MGADVSDGSKFFLVAFAVIAGLAVLGGGGYVVYQASDTAALARGEKYKATLQSVAKKYGLPGDLLFWVAYQESRFREDIITGKKLSPVGAAGMMQFMPATAKEWGVKVGDWQSSADGAGRYLQWLYKQLGNWSLAVAAYNYGIGNVKKKLTAANGNIAAALATMPKETKDYVRTVAGNIGEAVARSVA